MSSLRAAAKGHQKTHRERGQVSGRKHMGLLEKKKDYKLRAKDFHRKEKTIKNLKKKAQERNPDEFYFQMVHQRTKEGVHVKERNNRKYTADQIRLMKTQDFNYVNLKRNSEAKKIEKMQASLHLTEITDMQDRNHIFFVESKEEESEFDAAKQMNTVPELLSRTHNIPTVEMLHTSNFAVGQAKKYEKQKKNAYCELQKRIERERQLSQARDEMMLKRQLMGNGTVHKRTKNGNVSYRWKKIRKK